MGVLLTYSSPYILGCETFAVAAVLMSKVFASVFMTTSFICKLSNCGKGCRYQFWDEMHL